VRSFLPDYPEAGAGISSRQILGHLSGIRHYQPKDVVDGWDSKHFDTVRASLVTFQDDPLLSAPGEEEHYSTYAFTLLAAILEVAGGASFPELVEREVAHPLGLVTLAVDRRSDVVEGRVAFYDRDGAAAATVAAARNASYLDPSYKWAGGGLVASAEDLARFGAAHLAPGYLSARALAELFTPQRTRSGAEIAVGLSWRLAKDPAGRTIYHHSGSQEGARAFLLVYPEEKLVVALLSNLGGVPAKPLDHAVALAAPFLRAILAEGTTR
jgi:CubicO group peptidase (beta-lactamase class C family)